MGMNKGNATLLSQSPLVHTPLNLAIDWLVKGRRWFHQVPSILTKPSVIVMNPVYS